MPHNLRFWIVWGTAVLITSTDILLTTFPRQELLFWVLNCVVLRLWARWMKIWVGEACVYVILCMNYLICLLTLQPFHCKLIYVKMSFNFVINLEALKSFRKRHINSLDIRLCYWIICARGRIDCRVFQHCRHCCEVVLIPVIDLIRAICCVQTC